MINLLLIGKGRFGQKYISTLSTFKDINLIVANRDNWKQLIDNHPDGVMICTPPQSHIEIARYSLERNLPTMIEKPLSLSLREAETLQQYSAPILVNHSHLFSSKYQKLKQNLQPNIKNIWSMGFGNNEARDYSDLWDYGPHDISMILDLTQQFPNTIQCEKTHDRRFTIKLIFNTFITTSFIGYAANKDRYIRILYKNDQRAEWADDFKSDFTLPPALQVFIDAINGKSDYRLGLDLSLKVMRILELCQKSLDIVDIVSA